VREIEQPTIVTTGANEQIAPLHERMPVILHPEHEALRLAPDVTDPRAALSSLQPLPAERMELCGW
jgi:putative SOS response-associated peptidase YedK